MTSEKGPSLQKKYENLLTDIFEKEQLHRYDQGYPFWRITQGYGLGFDQNRIKLLSHILDDFPNPLLLIDNGGEISQDINGPWVSKCNNLWVIPSGINPSDLYKSLYEGDWHIYKLSSDEVFYATSGTEFFRYDYKTVIEFISEYKVLFILESGPDNHPWYFGLNKDIDSFQL